MSKNFIDRFYEEDTKDQFWSLNKKICAGFVVLFLSVIMINTTGCTQNSGEDITSIENNNPAESMPASPTPAEQSGAGVEDDVSVLSEEQQNSDDMVSLSVVDAGREDPFLPESERVVVKPKPKGQYDLLPPPESISVDSTALDVMTTKVSGIMFDKLNPSAILNIAGADYLVRSGDIINGYKILSIAKDIVTVQYGENVYKAGVGELLTGEGINYNTVSNLESKFGGRKNIANK